MLRCTSEVIHGNNGDQESWAIEAVCRTLGYAVLKTDHKKAARGIVNGQDEFGAWQPTVESLNASKIASESLCWWKKFSFQDLLSLATRTSEEDNEMSQDGIIMCHSSPTLYLE